MKKREKGFYQTLREIFSRPQPEVDRLAEGFHFILGRELSETDREMDLLRALGDRDSLVKEQIKHSTIQHVAEIFDECYLQVTGKPRKPKETENE